MPRSRAVSPSATAARGSTGRPAACSRRSPTEALMGRRCWRSAVVSGTSSWSCQAGRCSHRQRRAVIGLRGGGRRAASRSRPVRTSRSTNRRHRAHATRRFLGGNIVVLHRVVCCYPDFARLLGAAADHARRLLVFSYPPGNFGARLLVGMENLIRRIRRRPFRSFVHDHPGCSPSSTTTGYARRCCTAARGMLFSRKGYRIAPPGGTDARRGTRASNRATARPDPWSARCSTGRTSSP